MSASITSGTYPRAATRRRAGNGLSLRGLGQGLWAKLVAVGASRAAPQLNLLAVQYDTSNPELARLLRRAAREALSR